MRTMPEAFTCFFEGESYETTVRNVMYIGGDTDTLAAIAGAVAEAYYGIPASIVNEGKAYLTSEISKVAERFTAFIGGKE